MFTFNGDWQNGGYDKDAPGNIGFFLFPSAEEGGVHGSMGVPTTFGIAANAKHADCAAFFLDWVATNPEARQIIVTSRARARSVRPTCLSRTSRRAPSRPRRSRPRSRPPRRTA